MLATIPEKFMHRVRWFLACGWLILIFSLFYDPISPWLTDSNTHWSPFKINPDACITVQGVCLEQEPYYLGASLFWGLIVPSGVFMLLVFGHEFWRRICPLGFMSQLFRSLGKQRQRKRVDPNTGQTHYELVKIKADSWLGKNALKLQLALLYIGVCGRLLFYDSNRTILGVFLLLTIASAILVGYLYGGKTWCQYFCPMAPVQEFYGEPRGLLNSVAHEGKTTAITQSMCRRQNADGTETSACVACNSPCIDIDAERSYWDAIKKPDYKFLYYSYAGLVVGFFLYYYLYSGSWAYLLSGAWTHQKNQLELLFSPGFYLFNTPIPIPRLIAAPLTVGLFSALGYFVGIQLEKLYKTYQFKNNPILTPQQLQHQVFTLTTFWVFNFFFIFAGRSYIGKFPIQVQYLFNISLVLTSTLWLYRTWGRSLERYSRESLASRLRQQLTRLQVDVSRFLEGRSIDLLTADEVYVLAKILPGFTGDKRLEAYKGILRDSLEEGYVNTASSLEVLQQMRQELGISEQEHLTILTELGVEDPDLLDPNQKRSRENQLRLQTFRQRIRGMVGSKRRRGAKGLGRELLKVVKKEKAIGDVLDKEGGTVESLSREYGITLEEEKQIIANLDGESQLERRSDILLHQLQDLQDIELALLHPPATLAIPHLRTGLEILRSTVSQKQRVIAKGVLKILEQWDSGTEATRIVLALASLTPHVLPNLLEDHEQKWSERLSDTHLSRLQQQLKQEGPKPAKLSDKVMASYLETLLAEPDSLTKTVSLYLLAKLDNERGKQQARQLLDSYLMLNPSLKETAQQILANADEQETKVVTPLERLLYLSSCDLLKALKAESLMELSYQVPIKEYQKSDIIWEQGEVCKDLLMLLDGQVESQHLQEDETVIMEEIEPVNLLNELEILGNLEAMGTCIVTSPKAFFLVIEGSIFNELLAQDKGFSRKVIEQESRRLQQLQQLTNS
ncbi:4Fe-4S binding protein [Crocosphaera sp. XPORK-15E]|uniref:4Fe-4S binding protein n=1 Tax=Crocosphaera sp. XPORK-15E TaxID=3110247 RepID=UPI002B201255|nr:4Fe-4S binding protein [Crocosphaera sp. XPORK-15E]MEA5536027.1 4Fe-4S binding protein [Crocosphaera sp. XPORK-15E]